MSFRRLKGLVFLILFTYFIVGIVVNFLPSHERYPFYSWNLFSKVPNNETSYFLRITKIGDQDNKVILVGSKVGEYINIEDLQIYYWMIQDFGDKIEMGDPQNLRGQIEELFKYDEVTYEVLKIEYDPYKFIENGEHIELTVIENFSTN